MVIFLDTSLKHIAKIIKRNLSVDIASIPGASVAGDFGAGIIAFLVCKIRSDIDLVLPVYKKPAGKICGYSSIQWLGCCIQSITSCHQNPDGTLPLVFPANWKQVLICQRRSARFGVLLPK